MSTATERPSTTPWMDPILDDHGITDPAQIRAAKAEMWFIQNHVAERPSDSFRTACRAIANGRPLASPTARAYLEGATR